MEDFKKYLKAHAVKNVGRVSRRKLRNIQDEVLRNIDYPIHIRAICFMILEIMIDERAYNIKKKKERENEIKKMESVFIGTSDF